MDISKTFTKEQNQLCELYCQNNMFELRKICDPLIHMKKVAQYEHDDLYSVGLYTLYESLTTYDISRKCSFKTYLVGNIKRAFYDYTRDKNRKKRCNIQEINGEQIILDDISIDCLNEDGIDLIEKIPLPETISEIELSKNLNNYLNTLTNVEKKIAKLLLNGYELKEISSILHISFSQLNLHLKNMRSFEKQIVIKHENIYNSREDKIMNENYTQTLEKSKHDKLSIASIIKKINNCTIRFDHPLQRESEQWSNIMQGNLISDILQGNPIPALTFAEQIINGIAIVWDLDGKQRCTIAYKFRNDGFRISKNVRRWMMSYQTFLKDENGKVKFDENGFPMTQHLEFDIRNKKFSELPDELKDKFMDYNFEIVQYLNCNSEDIAYHIARYNEGKPMNVSQKGIIQLGEHFATIVKGISSMPFFKEIGNYTVRECNNGTVNRVVVESIMNINFLEDWKSEQSAICKFLKENASEETFDNFEDLVNRISKVINDETAEQFNSKDSFLWFGLFGRFINLGKDDEKFIEFMAEFSQHLHNQKINGHSFDDLFLDPSVKNAKNTKNKNVIINKMEFLTSLMMNYFNIEQTEKITENNENFKQTETAFVSLIDFVKNNISESITEQDVSDYEEDLEILTLDVDNTSNLLSAENHYSLIGIIAYSYKNEINIDDWFVDYFKRINTYKVNQIENLKDMISDLQDYINKLSKKGA